jgi:hypothetical protein
MDDLDFGGTNSDDENSVSAAFLDPDFDQWDGDIARALGRPACDFDQQSNPDEDGGGF